MMMANLILLLLAIAILIGVPTLAYYTTKRRNKRRRRSRHKKRHARMMGWVWSWSNFRGSSTKRLTDNQAADQPTPGS